MPVDVGPQQQQTQAPRAQQQAPADHLQDPLGDQAGLKDSLETQDLSGTPTQAEQLQVAKQGYEQALGSLLGGELFKVVSKELSRSKLEGLAQDAVDDAFSSVSDWLVSQVGASEQAIAKQFTAALEKALAPRVKELLADSGVTDAISDYAVDSPYSMLAAALAGAATYILSNQDLPTLKRKLGLGAGHTLLAKVDLGSTLDIAIRQATASYQYKRGGTSAELSGSYAPEDQATSLQGALKHSDAGGSYGLQGSYTHSEGSEAAALAATYSNQDLSAKLFGRHTRQDGKSLGSVGAELRGKYGADGDASYFATGQYNSDDTWKASAGTSFGDASDGGAWNLEAFAEERANAKDNWGAKLMYQLRF